MSSGTELFTAYGIELKSARELSSTVISFADAVVEIDIIKIINIRLIGIQPYFAKLVLNFLLGRILQGKHYFPIFVLGLHRHFILLILYITDYQNLHYC